MSVVAATARVMGWIAKDKLPDCPIHRSDDATISKDWGYGKRA
jgi:hypothetical protein